MTSELQRIVLAAALIAAMQLASAAESVDADRIAACAKERDEARRLACYDQAIAASKKATGEETAPKARADEPASSSPGAASKPTQTPAPAANSDSEFGVTGSAVARQRSTERAQQAGETDKADSITAVVTAVASKPHGELVITLDNGQVWAQKRKERYFPAKPGDKATINAGMLGSYRMVIGNRSTPVTRVK